MPDNKRSHHLLAPELLPALEIMPEIELNDEFMEMVRALPGDALMMEQPPLSPEQAAVHCEERHIPGPDGEVRVLVYMPAENSNSPRPGYLHIHGGGYVLGAPEMNDAANRSLVANLGCVAVSVDYRLAPETRWPGAVEDCYVALAWLHSEASTLNVDPSRIAVAGESAGGGHAAALALLVRERGEYAICLQMLDCPMLDDRTGDDHPYCGEYIWTPTNNRYGWRALLGVEPGSDAVPEGAVPGRVEDLSNLPPTYIAIGALDLFLEESLDYARRLIRGGVPTELHVVPGAFHAYQAATEAPQVKTSTRLAYAALARAWDQPD